MIGFVFQGESVIKRIGSNGCILQFWIIGRFDLELQVIEVIHDRNIHSIG